MVTSTYDVAAMILTPLISYIGGSRKKPVFCAWGVFAMGVGFLIFILPHFVSPPYEAGMSIWTVVTHLFGTSNFICSRTHPHFFPIVFSANPVKPYERCVAPPFQVVSKWKGISRALVRHTFFFVYLREFGSPPMIFYSEPVESKKNHCETTQDN